MSWDFAAAEALEGLHARYLTELMKLTDKPLRSLDVLREWRDAVAALQLKLEGAEVVTQVATAPSAPVHTAPPARAMNLAHCARGVHSWGPIDGRGWATCVACGQVSITGGNVANGAPSGGIEVARATTVEMP